MVKLTSLLKKEHCSNFTFTNEARKEFNSLKLSFTSTPILKHFDCTLFTIVKMDASDYALGAVLSQIHPSSNSPNEHLISFDSFKLLPEE